MGDGQGRDEDDHDLLTFGESGVRLREEIALTEAALRACSGAGRQDALQARLSALTDALARNSRQADANPGEKGFLDYVPPPPPPPPRPGSGTAGADADAEGSS